MATLTILVLAAVVFQGVTGLNIDSTTPTLTDANLPTEIGFGFTQTQHQFSDGRKTVLVSAPKANGQYDREGGVYSCPFVNGGSCQFESVFQSKMNVRGNDPFVAQPSSLNTSYVGQLLGYSLRSFDNHVVACAPLYVNRPTIIQAFGEDYQLGTPNGRCIILDSDLNATTPLQLFSEDVTSLHLAGVDTGTVGQGTNERLVFGSVLSGDQPIPTGQVFVTSLDPTLIGTDEVSSAGGVSSLVPLTGYHIDTGYFTTPGVRQIVTSAPRSDDHFGRVEVLSIGVTLTSEYTIIGNEGDGYFGYDFAVLNFDPEVGQLDGLVVGCPLCNRERGRVYVYTHSGDPTNPFTESVIEAPSLERGRFGLSVENIGDIDLDGIDDIAVSAPFEGSGVVYVYRGSPSGLVANDPQVIQAAPGSSAFGYVVTGGLDIDDNGYPDITISDLSGSHVTSYRSSPLVNVTFNLADQRDTLDILGDSDRVCELSDGVSLVCFTVSPCFQFNSQFGDVTRFELSYEVTVDSIKSRANLYQVDSESGEVTIGPNSYAATVTIDAPRDAGRVCVSPLTFALSADFTDTSPIPVQLSIDDIPDPLPLDSTPSSDELGGALHPILRRYIRGDTPVPLSLEYEINFNLNCTGEASPDECEPNYKLGLQETFDSADLLVLASANEFSYRVNVTNEAADDGLSPMLLVQLAEGLILERSASLSPSALTECNTRPISDQSSDFTTAIECSLRNPTLAGTTLQLELIFGFNVSAIPLNTSSLELNFTVVDGASNAVVTSENSSVMVEAVGDFDISSVVPEERYQAYRNTIFQNATTIPLNETGPLLNLRVSVRNSRDAANGTVFPRTTLLVYLPVALQGNPLIVPTEVIVSSGSVNCSHDGAIPSGLSVIQQPTGFIPPWTGEPLPQESGCDQFTCGIIICTIVDLSPVPAPPTQLTLFARLFSPGVTFSGSLTIFSRLISATDLPLEGPDTVSESEVSFMVAPAITEIQQDCVPYWVVVVSVVIGIFALIVIISILACCGLFRHWYKAKKSEAVNGNGVEHTDSDTFQRRTIPPIPGLTQSGSGQPELMSYVATDDNLDEDKEKETEAEEELEREQMEMAQAQQQPAVHQEPADGAEGTDDLVFDPAVGVHDDDGGEETAL